LSVADLSYLPQGRDSCGNGDWQKSRAKRQISDGIYIVLITSPFFIYINLEMLVTLE